MTALTIALGDIHPLSLAVTPELAAAEGLNLQIQRLDPIHDAFSPMVRDQSWDLSEMAIVTGIQAVAFGRPLRLLPVTLAARFQHKCIVHDTRRGMLGPDQLVGKKVGVRAYTQTTGAWVRAILQGEYGLHPRSVQWVTQKGAHVTEYIEPSEVIRVGPEKSLLGMLETGEIDAAIFGNDLPERDWLAPVIPDPNTAARNNFDRNHVVAINHVLCISEQTLQDNEPDLVGRIMRLMTAAKAMASPQDPDLFPLGLQAMKPSLNALIQTIHDQGLVPRSLSVDDLFLTDAKARQSS